MQEKHVEEYSEVFKKERLRSHVAVLKCTDKALGFSPLAMISHCRRVGFEKDDVHAEYKRD